jgi:hypothetical protein
LGCSAEEVPSVLAEYRSDARAIEKILIRIGFYMRGGAPHAHMMTPRQRLDALAFIEENMERTAKSGSMMH